MHESYWRWWNGEAWTEHASDPKVVALAVPNVSGKQSFDSVYGADDFVVHLRDGGWDPGPLPEAVIFTYAGFDLLCAALPAEYTMRPMLDPAPAGSSP